MEENGSSTRIVLDADANSLAFNKDHSCIAVAGRSRKFLCFDLSKRNSTRFLISFSAKSVQHRSRWLRGGAQHAPAAGKQQEPQPQLQFQRNRLEPLRDEYSRDVSDEW